MYWSQRKTSHLTTLFCASALLVACGGPGAQGKVTTHPVLAGAAHSVADVAERSVKSVVNIASSRVVVRRHSPFYQNPFFRRFFRGFGKRRARRRRSLGSGVIVSASGVVLTNNHVVAHGERIRVKLSDGRELAAKIVGTDPKSDLAVLQLQGKLGKLTPLTFGDSNGLRLGDPVLAIGNPFGVGQTVTMGIVSATGRANVGIVDYEDFIQTDAAINPGNSGGALVGLDGRLVGINTAILSRSGGYQGIGFAIPAQMAQQIMESILEHGKVVRGWLGLSVQELTPELARALAAGERRGVLVSDVLEKSPAAKAKLKRGDILLTIGGSAVTNAARYRSVVSSAGAGRKVKVRYLREGKEHEVEVELMQMPTTIGGVASVHRDAGSLGGVTVVGLSDAVRDKYNLPKRLKVGVVVEKVAPNSRAAGVGLRPGDLILEINRRPIRSVQAFDQLYRRNTGRLLLVVMRNGRSHYLLLRP